MSPPDPGPPSAARRPLKSRSSRWANALAAGLAARGARPNAISLASVGFAAVGAGALLASRGEPDAVRAALYVAAAACAQLRLLCNLLDGLVAVEGGRGSRAGEVYNDLPDRFADVLLLVPVGYVAAGLPYAVEVGWVAALFAVLTAYVRVLGGAAGLPQRFSGPMAKPHRMALLTGALVIAAGAAFFEADRVVLYGALVIVALGSAATVARRTRDVVRALMASAPGGSAEAKRGDA